MRREGQNLMAYDGPADLNALQFFLVPALLGFSTYTLM